MLGLRGIMLWAGTEQALDCAVQAQAQVNERMRAGPYSEDGNPADPFMRVGNVAVVPVRGPLVNIDSPILAFFGIASYPCIRRTLVAAASDPTIQQILLDVDSGGGAVSGATDTYDLIARINAKIKPVTTFAGGTMASAAYWFGCAAGEIYCSPTSLVGSIGILVVHIDRTKQMQQDGLKPTVLRSGKYKALINPFEELTPEAREQMEDQLEAVHAVFTQNVADALGVTYKAVEDKMGQGREFIGEAALAVGLVGGISTFDAVLSSLQSKKNVDKPGAIYDNGINKKRSSSMPQAKATLTEQQIAALASGATAEVVAPAVVAVTTGEAPAAPVVETTPAAASVAEAGTAPAAAAPAPAAAPVTVGQGELVAFLQGQVKEKDIALTEGAIQRKALEDKLIGIEGTHIGLLEIAKASINNMQVGLNRSAADLSALTAVAVLAEHKRLSDEFEKKYKVGGVAAVPAKEAASAEALAAGGALHTARVNATKSKKK